MIPKTTDRLDVLICALFAKLGRHTNGAPIQLSVLAEQIDIEGFTTVDSHDILAQINALRTHGYIALVSGNSNNQLRNSYAITSRGEDLVARHADTLDIS